MARLTFSNVPTATGGVISGNIGIGAGSPFGAGGKYEAQVSDIKATIAKAPKGFYDPVGWDDFLKKSEQIGLQPTRADDPEIMEDLLKIESVRNAVIGLATKYEANPHWTYQVKLREHYADQDRRKKWQKTIALHIKLLMEEKNAPAIQALEQHERQLEIDQAVKLALEQKIRETAIPEPTPTCTTCDSDKCQECNAWDIQCELGHMANGTCTPPEKPPDEPCDIGCVLTGRGCDCGCKDVKPCTTCDSDICKECDAWDIQCEDCRKKDGTCTKPPETKTMLFWAKIIAVVIGIGVFLWLLRPLFSRGSKPTGGFTIIPQ